MLHGRIMGAPLHTVALVGQYPALINLNGKKQLSEAYIDAALEWPLAPDLEYCCELLTAPATRRMQRRRRSDALDPTLQDGPARCTPSRARADPCRPSVPGCLQGHVARISARMLLKAKTRGTADQEHPSARHRRAHTNRSNKNHIYTRWGRARARGSGLLGRRTVLERRRVRGRRRREHVGHLRRPEREGRTSGRADHG